MGGGGYIYRGRKFNVKIVRRALPTGRHVDVEVVEYRGASVVLPLFGDRVLMLRQYRPAVDDWIYELPAGTIREGETPESCALRELLEETGYRAGDLKLLFKAYVSPGYSTEVIHSFLAWNLEYVGARRESYGVIEVVPMKLEEAMNMVLENRIRDVKTMLTLLFYYEKFLKNTSVSI